MVYGPQTEGDAYNERHPKKKTDQGYSGYMATYQGDYSPYLASLPKVMKVEDLVQKQDDSTMAKTIGESNRDLQLQIRSEIGEDGDEAYFETYISELKVGNVNIFINRRDDNYFLLGSDSGAGILGSTKYGSVTAGSTRVEELQCIQDFRESFTSTTYRDTGSTTAGGWGFGSLVFTTAGSQAVFSSWKSGSYLLTDFDRIRIDIQYTQYGGSLTSFNVSFNGGSDYTTIDPFNETTITPVGSDFRLKVLDPHGSLILTRIDVITKGEGFT